MSVKCICHILSQPIVFGFLLCFLMKPKSNVKMVETKGFGIHKMFVSKKDRYLPMPNYDKSDYD